MGGGGGGTQRPVWHVYETKKDRRKQRTGGQNPLVNKNSLFLH